MLQYTSRMEDLYWGYGAQASAEIKSKIENMDETATITDWKGQFQRIEKEYTCSARFFLMRYLFEKAGSISDVSETYTVSNRGKNYTFHKVSVEYALYLPEKERNLYIELLTQIASDNHGEPLKAWRPLIWKAMLRNRKLELMTRQEGFELAHGLKFNLKQAEEFLLRVLDNDGFCYTRSEDIIEAFCFQYEPANNRNTAKMLKEHYAQAASAIPKVDILQKPDDFTRKISRNIADYIAKWKNDKENVTERFMEWLITQAPMLDIPSYSAYKLYRRLAACAYEITMILSGDGDTDISNLHPEFRFDLERSSYDDFTDVIKQYCFDEHYDLTEADPYKAASALLKFASIEFDNERKRKPDQIWRYLTVGKHGEITAKAVGIRIPLLLSGTETVTKGDLLFMLWYTCDLFWTACGKESEILLYDRISGFWSLSEELLDAAVLPGFYAPHILERSFLNAICAGIATEDSPFEIYEGMCEFVLPQKKKRNRLKTADPVSSKKSRAKMEKDAEELYYSDQLNFEGVERALMSHFLEYGKVNGQYSFGSKGIYYSDGKAAVKNPDMEIAILYPKGDTGIRFDMNRENYNEEKVMEERFRFLYGLSMYLTDNFPGVCEYNFRINYQKRAMISIIS